MVIGLSIGAIVISILAIFINQWVSPFPGLGIGFQYHRRWVQLGIAFIAISLALTLYLISPAPGRLFVLGLVLFLTPCSGFNHASRLLVAVDRPEHAAAAAAGWEDEALVIGYAAGEQAACAWLLDTLIPHHLVNDFVAGRPVLAAW